MLHIAICDDEPSQLAGLEALLREYLRARPSLAGRVTPFSDSCALVEAARERGGFDLYLLDVLLPGMGGIQVGLRLRELGDGGQIIYLTASSEYAVDSYTVGAFFYLLKPVGRETLFQVLDRAVEQQLCRRAEGVVVPTREGPRRLLLEQIYYAERVGRCIRYYCAGKTVDSVTLRTSFREAAAPSWPMAGSAYAGPAICLTYSTWRGWRPAARCWTAASGCPCPAPPGSDSRRLGPVSGWGRGPGRAGMGFHRRQVLQPPGGQTERPARPAAFRCPLGQNFQRLQKKFTKLPLKNSQLPLYLD